MHLYGSILERYKERALPPAHLAALDAHVSNCIFCAHSLADQTVLSTGWGRRGWLGRLVRVERDAAVDAEDQPVGERVAA
jgi:hypothetical protein